MDQAEPFPLADDFTPGDPTYLAHAPEWFRAWRREEFVPLSKRVATQLTLKRAAVELGRIALYSGGTLLATRFPELKPLLLQLLGAG
jgi:hypothetical protein